jgi:hypothetical protein
MRPWLLAAALIAAGLSAGAREAPSSLSIPAYKTELERVQSESRKLAVQPQTAEELRMSLPESWNVSEGDRQVEVSTAFMRDALSDFQKVPPDKKRALLDQLDRRLAAMRDQAASFVEPGKDEKAMRARLDEILSAREFRFIRPPSVWEIWRDKVIAWLDRWIRRASNKVPDVPGFGRTMVWVVIGLAACVLAVWLYRTARQRPFERTREIIPFASSSKSWQTWMAEANDAAAEGDWRNAVHLAYWAAVSYLESGGAWPPDRARTPREYLRALTPSHPAKDAFTVLTRRFEAIWYGGRAAGPAEFRATRMELEELGCR